MRRTLTATMESLSTAERRAETVIVGALLTLGSAVAPILGIALLGYAVCVVRSAAESDAALPTFGGWGDVLLTGGRAALAVLPLHLPGLVVLRFAIGFDRAHLVSPYLFADLRNGVLPALDLFAGVLAIVVLEIVAGYLSVAALVAVAHRRSVGVGLVETALEVARDGAYARAFSVALAAGTVGHVLGGVVAAVPLVGEPASAAVSFLALVVGASVVGHACSSAGGPGGPDGSLPFHVSSGTAADGVHE
ncbi:DUF4013 domain-containing protein [Halopelagius fulvigenes]|uniref:DUF4013 domain-containing protein n=1 Tax=Halopelagius fulvigenes TaxID=1198324 RepID=A0ABD5U4K8_9EURY